MLSIQYLAIIPLLKRNTSKEIIMDNSIIDTENKIIENVTNSTDIIHQFKNASILPVKRRKLKTLTWNGISYLSEIESIELSVWPSNFSVTLNGTNKLLVVRCDREEMENLGFTLFSNKDNSFSFEFNGEIFDNECVDSTHYKLLSFWEKETYNLDELINEWLARIFKVKQD